jgi:hypothetical protein
MFVGKEERGDQDGGGQSLSLYMPRLRLYDGGATPFVFAHDVRLSGGQAVPSLARPSRPFPAQGATVETFWT